MRAMIGLNYPSLPMRTAAKRGWSRGSTIWARARAAPASRISTSWRDCLRPRVCGYNDCHCEEPKATRQSRAEQAAPGLLRFARNDDEISINAPCGSEEHTSELQS